MADKTILLFVCVCVCIVLFLPGMFGSKDNTHNTIKWTKSVCIKNRCMVFWCLRSQLDQLLKLKLQNVSKATHSCVFFITAKKDRWIRM